MNRAEFIGQIKDDGSWYEVYENEQSMWIKQLGGDDMKELPPAKHDAIRSKLQ